MPTMLEVLSVQSDIQTREGHLEQQVAGDQGTRPLPWGPRADLHCIPLLQTSPLYSGQGKEGVRTDTKVRGLEELMVKEKEAIRDRERGRERD